MDLDQPALATLDWTESSADAAAVAAAHASTDGTAPTWSRALLKAGAQRREPSEPLGQLDSSAQRSAPTSSASQPEGPQIMLACGGTFAAVLIVLLLVRPSFCVQQSPQGKRLRWSALLLFAATSASLTYLACTW